LITTNNSQNQKEARESEVEKQYIETRSGNPGGVKRFETEDKRRGG
jgi:hypothetical protein